MTNPGGVVEVRNSVTVELFLCQRTLLLPLSSSHWKLTLFPSTALTAAGCSVNLSSIDTKQTSYLIVFHCHKYISIIIARNKILRVNQRDMTHW